MHICISLPRDYNVYNACVLTACMSKRVLLIRTKSKGRQLEVIYLDNSLIPLEASCSDDGRFIRLNDNF